MAIKKLAVGTVFIPTDLIGPKKLLTLLLLLLLLLLLSLLLSLLLLLLS
jgi:hypothetical protein